MNKDDRHELSVINKDLGYLTAKVEDLSNDLGDVKEVCAELRDTLQHIRDDISFAKATIRVVKVAGAAIAAMIVFNYKMFVLGLKGMF